MPFSSALLFGRESWYQSVLNLNGGESYSFDLPSVGQVGDPETSRACITPSKSHLVDEQLRTQARAYTSRASFGTLPVSSLYVR